VERTGIDPGGEGGRLDQWIEEIFSWRDLMFRNLEPGILMQEMAQLTLQYLIMLALARVEK
jgi:hypothetical protein